MSTPATPLFRPEVMQAQAVQWLGSIRIGRPPSFGIVTGVALACAVALVSFAAWGQVTRKVSVPGILVPEGGLMHLSSPQAATVAEVLVKEGDAVQAGQPLIRLRAERMMAGGELSQMQLAAVAQRRSSLEAELRLADQQAQQRSSALQDRLRSLQSDVLNLQGELDATLQRVQLAQKNTQRFTELAASGFVSGVQAQEKQEALLDLGLRERNARRALEAAQREQASVQSELSGLRNQLETARSQLQRQLASLAQEGSELDARAGWTITAPAAGTVSAMSALVGQSALAGGTLISLVPASGEGEKDSQVPSALVAHLYAPSRSTGFVAVGQSVWVRYAAFPYQKFGMQAGRVMAVSRTPISPQDLPTGQSQALMQAVGSTEPLYRITVALERQSLQAYGTEQGLKAGMTLDAQVRQEGRAIWEWVLEPVLALAK
jgi:membrane fusion protein